MGWGWWKAGQGEHCPPARPGRAPCLPATYPIRKHRERGFALLIVLWSLALLALLGTRVTSAGRTEAQLARNLRDAAVAEAAADGAIHQAVFHLLDRSARRWVADGQMRRIEGSGVSISVLARNPAGLVNPNSAPPALMAALIREVGGDPRSAPAIGAAIFDWRVPGQIASPAGAKAREYAAAGRAYAPPGRPFADVHELGAVLGMTPALLAALRPHLSLYNFGRIEPAFASPVVRRALAAASVGQPALEEVGQIVLLRADVTLPNGAGFTRRAAVLLTPATNGRPFRVLSWESGSD